MVKSLITSYDKDIEEQDNQSLLQLYNLSLLGRLKEP